MSYNVSQRTHEIGIRLAVGASTRDVIGLVVAKGFRLTSLGVVIGAFGSFAITTPIRSQLYGVTATDPGVFAGDSVFLGLVGSRPVTFRLGGRQP